MTVCNMSIEGGARAGLIAPDEKTFAYHQGPAEGAEGRRLGQAMRYWETLKSDEGREFDRVIKLDAATLPPIVSWGTSPEDVLRSGLRARPDQIADEGKRAVEAARARVHGAEAGHPDHRHPARHDLDRLLHQWPHRGPARGRQASSKARRSPPSSSTP